MKVLFWVDTFPVFSETFIRDQIVSLLNHEIDVLIHSSDVIKGEDDALKNYEKYGLLHKKVNINKALQFSKIKRVRNALILMILSLFKGNFKYYRRALNYKKYGYKARSLRLLFQVDFILKNNIDVIHAHFGPNGVKASDLKRLGLPIKLFTTFHGYDIRLGLEKGGNIYEKLFKNSDGVFSISDYNHSKLVAFGCEEKKIIDLTNGVSTSFFRRKEKVNIEGKVRILSVARLVEEKALHIAIEAVIKQITEHIKVKIEYLIVGEGPERKKLQTLIDNYNLTDSIKLLGVKNSNEVRDLMINSDMFLLSSIAEALPTVLLEAQASELVILATDVGNVKKMVKGGLAVSKSTLFKKGMDELLLNRNNWREIGKQGRAYVKNNHDIDILMNEMIEHYGK